MVNYLNKVAADLKRQLSLPHPVAAHARRMKRDLRLERHLSGADGQNNDKKTPKMMGKKVIK